MKHNKNPGSTATDSISIKRCNTIETCLQLIKVACIQTVRGYYHSFYLYYVPVPPSNSPSGTPRQDGFPMRAGRGEKERERERNRGTHSQKERERERERETNIRGRGWWRPFQRVQHRLQPLHKLALKAHSKSTILMINSSIKAEFMIPSHWQGERLLKNIKLSFFNRCDR